MMNRSRPAPGWALAPVLGSLSCGPSVSLDPAMPTTGQVTTETTTSADETGSSSMSSGTDPETTHSTDSPPDDVPDPPLPPGACPAECTVQFDETWTWDEELLGEPPFAHSVTAITRGPSDALVLAEQRDGQAWIRRFNDEGTALWYVPAELECDCEIFGLAVRPDEVLLIAGHGLYPGEIPVVMMAALNQQQPTIYHWKTWDGLYDSENYRVGPLMLIDEYRAGFPVVDADIFAEGSMNERLQFNYYEDSFLFEEAFIDSQPAQDATWLPSGWAASPYAIALGFTHDAGPEPEGYVVWLSSGLDPTFIEPLPAPPDAMASATGDDVFVLSHTASPDALTLHLSHSRPGLPLSWSTTLEVPGVSMEPPTLIAHDGLATIAVRTAGGDSGDATLTLARVDTDGFVLWTSTRSVSSDPSPMLVEAFDDDIVVATIVDRLTHIEKLEPRCACE